MTKVNNSLLEIKEKIFSFDKILLSSHVFPDPDAIGSSFSLAMALSSLGKDAEVYLGDSPPEFMASFIKGVKVTRDISCYKNYLLISTDTGDTNRVWGDRGFLLKNAKTVINIDHHKSNPMWGDLNYVDSTSSSSSEIVLELLELMNIEFTKSISNLLFAGLSDDTGSFKYSNVTSTTFKNASKLLTYGASPSDVSLGIYFTKSYESVILKAKVISNLTLELDKKVSLVVLTKELMSSLNAKEDDVSGIVGEARSIKGVKVSIFIREVEGLYKVSLRSKSDDIDVSKIASFFGGGGHKAASGFTYKGDFLTLKEKILSKIKEELD